MAGPSANNNPSTFMGSVRLLTNEEKYIQLYNYVIKSCEEFGTNENLNALNKILAELQCAQFPIPVFGAIATKFQLHGKYNLEELKSTITKLKNMVEVLPKDTLKKMAKFPALYFLALKSLTNACLAKKVPLLGISTLHDAINWCTDGHPELLTPAHSWFLCLCLKARHFYLVEPFINIDAELLLQQGIDFRKSKIPFLSSLGSEPVISFFYYAALIRTTQCRYKEAQLLLEQLICMRGMCNSAIVIEGFKLAILLALILGETQLFLPGSRNLKFLQQVSRPYMALAYIVSTAKLNDNIPAKVREFAEKNQKIFQNDNMLGLIDVLVQKLQERRIAAMPKTFTKIDRRRAMTRTFINDNEHFDSIIRKLIVNGELECSIDGAADLYNFKKLDQEEEEKDKDGEPEAELIDQLQSLATLTTAVKNIHDRLKVVPVSQSAKYYSKKRVMM